jgi:hypothetical protein
MTFVYGSEEIIHDYKNKRHNHILRVGSSKADRKSSITNQADEKILHSIENVWRRKSLIRAYFEVHDVYYLFIS